MVRGFRILTALALSALIVACATQAQFLGSSVTPAAEGDVKVTRDDSGNATVRVRARHLAPPARLTPSRSHYVVWAETPQGKTRNLGLLGVDEDLGADFTGTTALDQFRVLVTAEDIATPGHPSRAVVVETEILKP